MHVGTKISPMSLETEALSVRRKGYLQRAILTSLAVAGVLAISMVAPNTLQLLGGLGRGNRFNERTHSSLGRLLKKGFVEFDNHKRLRLTENGKRALALMERVSKDESQKRKHWDERWRLVIFDVPEYRKIVRNRLRLAVQEFGFLRVQDSVWVYPYDCEELIVLLKADLRIGKDVLYAIVERIENDGWIREHFKLPH